VSEVQFCELCEGSQAREVLQAVCCCVEVDKARECAERHQAADAVAVDVQVFQPCESLQGREARFMSAALDWRSVAKLFERKFERIACADVDVGRACMKEGQACRDYWP
jgi:hypothetical protein